MGGVRIASASDIETRCRHLVATLDAVAKRADATQHDLLQFMASVITDIRSGAYFENPTGQLGNHLWRRAAGANGVEAGWSGPSAIYGPVHEFGPHKRAWTIRPGKGIVGPGYKRSGLPTKMLRITKGGTTYYARKVVIRWNRATMSKPHWKPAIKKLMPAFLASLGKRVVGK